MATQMKVWRHQCKEKAERMRGETSRTEPLVPTMSTFWALDGPANFSRFNNSMNHIYTGTKNNLPNWNAKML